MSGADRESEKTSRAERGAGGRGAGAEITEMGFNSERQNSLLCYAPITLNTEQANPSIFCNEKC